MTDWTNHQWNKHILPQKLKWFCVNCQHYVTDHVPEDILEDAAEKGFNISPYIRECRKCDCMMYEKPDVAPDDNDSAEFIREYKRLLKELGLRRA